MYAKSLGNAEQITAYLGNIYLTGSCDMQLNILVDKEEQP